MLVYLYLIKFKNGEQTVAVGQVDHDGEDIDEILCSEPQWVSDEETVDEIISFVKEKMNERVLRN